MAEFFRAINANIPPLPLEVNRVKQVLIQNHGATARNITSHKQYAKGVAAIRFYHKQATNMTLAEQDEYIRNIDNGWFVIEESALTKPSNHRACRNNVYMYPYSWAKWVLLNALYPGNKLNKHHDWAETNSATMSSLTSLPVTASTTLAQPATDADALAQL